MAEIKSLPWNGFKVVSTFSGGGGSCLGYRMAGYKVVWANEFVEAARDTYKANFKETILDGRDIRVVKPEEILTATGLKVGEIDLFDGSPPCASFSTAGKREAAWGKVKQYSDTAQRTDDLFFEYTRLLKGLQPKTFVAENVSGLVKGTAKGYFKEILAALKGCGYRVAAQLLDAQWLGVPQTRQRIIFVGVRNDLGLEPAYPSPLPYRYSVRDALPWLTSVVHDTSGAFGSGEVIGRPSPAITVGVNSVNSLHFKVSGVEPDADISRYAIGKEWDKLKPGEQSEKCFQLVKPDLNAPSPTITQRGGDASVASVTHPTERRKFSIAELKRICSFPDDFVLTGTYAQQWERCGRSVPPVMMSHIAATVRDRILARLSCAA
jgi:DNA (cytosine-5)-methyltransferase 1